MPVEMSVLLAGTMRIHVSTTASVRVAGLDAGEASAGGARRVGQEKKDTRLQLLFTMASYHFSCLDVLSLFKDVPLS